LLIAARKRAELLSKSRDARVEQHSSERIPVTFSIAE